LARCDRLEARELAEGDAVATGRRDGHTVCGRFAARTAAATLPVDAYERDAVRLVVPRDRGPARLEDHAHAARLVELQRELVVAGADLDVLLMELVGLRPDEERERADWRTEAEVR